MSSDRQRAARRVQSAAVLAVLAGIALACGENTDTTSSAGTGSTAAPAVLGPGSPIAEGFRVPDDAVLLLAPLPQTDGAGEVTGWSARLRPADAIGVFTDLVAQAEAQGFAVGAYAADPCQAVPDERTVAGHELGGPGEPLPDGVEPLSIDCIAVGYRTAGSTTQQVAVTVSQHFRHEAPNSDAALSVDEIDPGDVRPIGTGQFDLQPLTATRVRPASTPIDMEPPARAIGAPVSSSDLASAFTLVEGSRLVVPVAEDICQGGFMAALDVTGDPDEVLDAYVAQMDEMAEQYGTPARRSSTELLGRRIEHAIGSFAETSTVTATLVVGGDDEPTRLLLEECNG